MALNHINVTVATTATPLITLPNGVGYVAVQVGNRDTAAIYLGDAGVGVATSTGNAGQSVAANSNAQIWMHGNDTLYAVSAAGTAANAVSVIYSA
jgi:hypothetical protein